MKDEYTVRLLQRKEQFESIEKKVLELREAFANKDYVRTWKLFDDALNDLKKVCNE
jgi:hypothetical protein